MTELIDNIKLSIPTGVLVYADEFLKLWDCGARDDRLYYLDVKTPVPLDKDLVVKGYKRAAVQQSAVV